MTNHVTLLTGGKAEAEAQQWGDVEDVEGEEGSEEEGSESMPSPSNNFNFPPDIVARFQEGYQGHPAAGMEAMRKTYVKPPSPLSSSPHGTMIVQFNHILPSCCRDNDSPSLQIVCSPQVWIPS